MSTITAEYDWSTNEPVRTTTTNFGPGDTFVLHFHTPTKAVNGLAHISYGEYQSAPWFRNVVLSSVAGDMSHDSNAKAWSQSQNGAVWFSVGPNIYGAPVLALDTDYYLNVQNQGNGGGNIVVDVSQPPKSD